MPQHNPVTTPRLPQATPGSYAYLLLNREECSTMFASNVARGVLDLVAFSPKKLVRNLTVSASRAEWKNVKSLPIKRQRLLQLYIYSPSLRNSRSFPYRTGRHDRHVRSS
jgi:hypothetical protein